MSLEERIAQVVEETVRRAVEPLREEIQRLRAANEPQITIAQAAERLSVSTRCVQRWLKDGRLELVMAGGIRMVRWPPRTPPR